MLCFIRHLPLYLADYVKRKLQQHGVEPVAERLVTDVRYCAEYDDCGLKGYMFFFPAET